MKALLYMIGIKHGGGLNDAKHLLHWLPKVRPAWDFVAIVPAGHGYEAYGGSDNCTVVAKDSRTPESIWRLYQDLVEVPRIVRKHDIDLVFTVCNNGPVFTAGASHVVMLRRPQYVYSDVEGVSWSVLERARYGFLKSLFQASVVFADAQIVQTETMRERLQEHFVGCSDIHVVGKRIAAEGLAQAPGIRAPSDEGPLPRLQELRGQTDEFLLLYMTSYYPHKNLDRAAEGVLKAIQRGVSVRLLTTVDENRDTSSREFVRRCEAGRFSPAVTNLGRVPMHQIRGVYECCDAVLSTSLLESLSGIYLEGLAFGKPLIVSDRDFAHTVCGDAALYVDPLDPDDISNKVATLARDPELQRRLSEAGRARYAAEYDRTWEEIAREYAQVLEGASGLVSDATVE